MASALEETDRKILDALIGDGRIDADPRRDPPHLPRRGAPGMVLPSRTF